MRSAREGRGSCGARTCRGRYQPLMPGSKRYVSVPHLLRAGRVVIRPLLNSRQRGKQARNQWRDDALVRQLHSTNRCVQCLQRVPRDKRGVLSFLTTAPKRREGRSNTCMKDWRRVAAGEVSNVRRSCTSLISRVGTTKLVGVPITLQARLLSHGDGKVELEKSRYYSLKWRVARRRGNFPH